MEEEKFYDSVDFYESCIKYMKMWECSFDQASKFTQLTLQQEILWKEIEESAITIKYVIAGSINIDDLFDERAY